MAYEQWIEQALQQLAERAWSGRRPTPSNVFVLRGETLPEPNSPGAMSIIVQRMYAHARTWAPGFEVPFYVPKVNVCAYINAAGQFRVDSDGYVLIDVCPQFIGHPPALLAILAHEACHHILEMSGIRKETTADNERLTDLAIFVCGFGGILLDGQWLVRQVDAGWSTAHLGYLSPEQYALAQGWVLRAQNLQSSPRKVSPQMDASSASTLAGPFGPLKSFFHRLKSVLWPGKERVSRGDAAANVRTSTVHLPDPTPQRRKAALARLGGDASRLESLMEYERRRNPSANDLALLNAVIDSLERDRR